MTEKSSEIVIKINSKVLQILRVVAKSEKPLSSGDIEKRLLGVTTLRNKRDPQVYSILKRVLCPQKYKYPVLLFDWNELVSSIMETQKKGETSTFDRVRRTLVNNFVNIGLKFEENAMEFTRADDSLIEIKTSDSSIIKVERDSKHEGHAVLKVSKNGEGKITEGFDLIIKTVGKKRLNTDTKLKEKPSPIRELVFCEIVKGDRFERGISYLKTSLNEKSRIQSEMIRNIGKQRAIGYHKRHLTTPREGEMWTNDNEDSLLSEIQGNRSHWEYSLNTRGLILLVLGIIEEEKGKKGRVRNVELSNILKNLSENFKIDFPFLMYYNEIKEFYDGLGCDYVQVHHLKQVSLELQNIIDTIDTNELNYYLSSHYSTRLTYIYAAPYSNIMGYPEEVRMPNAIKQYHLINLEIIRKYLDEELANTKYTIQTFLSPIGNSLQ